MSVKQFPFRVIVSAITGRLLTELKDFYGILNHMTGDNLCTHQLPRAGRFCKPFLLRQFPDFSIVDSDEMQAELDANIAACSNKRQATQAWLETVAEKCGASLAKTYAVSSLPDGSEWQVMDPVEEMEHMLPPEKQDGIIVVNYRKDD